MSLGKTLKNCRKGATPEPIVAADMVRRGCPTGSASGGSDPTARLTLSEEEWKQAQDEGLQLWQKMQGSIFQHWPDATKQMARRMQMQDLMKEQKSLTFKRFLERWEEKRYVQVMTVLAKMQGKKDEKQETRKKMDQSSESERDGEAKGQDSKNQALRRTRARRLRRKRTEKKWKDLRNCQL